MKCDFRSASLVADVDVKKSAASLESYRRELAQLVGKISYNTAESSIQLPYDEKSVAEILRLAKKKSSKSLKFVVVIGIGGSNLGTQAVFDALEPRTDLLFLDTVSTHTFHQILSTLKICSSKNEFLLVSISKSGGTTETIANTEALLAALVKPFGNVLDRLVIITGKDSKFWNAAMKQGVDCLTIAEHVGGRYSVFSAVGLFPLALAGVNIKQLLLGARDAVNNATSRSYRSNRALSSAATTYSHATHGRTTHNTFLFAPELESLGKWERQLMAESLGKDGKGILPIVSIGTTDMHSMAQLYYGGIDNIFTTILTAPSKSSPRLPKKLVFPGLVEDIENTSLEQLMHAIAQGARVAYKKLGRPLVSIELERVDAYELGYYLQFRMIEMMYLAKLLGVNAFDQPMVEAYKKERRALLKKKA